jgi:hypothetical protein
MRIRTIGAVAVAAALFLAPAASAAQGESPRDRLLRAREQLADARESLTRTTSQRDEALAQRDEALAAAARARGDAADWRRTTYLLVGLILVALGWASIRRRHTVRVRIPDSLEGWDEPSDDRADRRHP